MLGLRGRGEWRKRPVRDATTDSTVWFCYTYVELVLLLYHHLRHLVLAYIFPEPKPNVLAAV